jgi:hypothetical protein
MAMGDTDLRLVRDEITKLLRAKYQSEPRVWAAAEAIRYRNLCELEQALLAFGRLDSAAS